jgi:hypothetical protein
METRIDGLKSNGFRHAAKAADGWSTKQLSQHHQGARRLTKTEGTSTMLAVQLEDAKRKMTQIRSSLDREVEQIRTSARLSDQGRIQELAKAVLAHRQRADTLRNTVTVDNEGTRVKLSAKLFGIPPGADPATVLVYRDACDRAARLESADDAAAMVKRANEMGDDLLARAVAGHAHGQKWRDVTASYAESAGLSDYLDDLNALPSGGLLKTAMNALFRVPTPNELQPGIGDASDSQLERVAAGETPP